MSNEPISTPKQQAATARMGELSRELQLGWIEKLFERLVSLYGRTFHDMWAGVDMTIVKTEWADALRHYTGLQIAWALDQCRASSDFPPTLPKFLGLCRAAPRPEVPALPAPQVSPEVAAERAKAIGDQAIAAVSKAAHHGWATRILSDIAAGVVLPRISEQFAIEALQNLGRLDEAPADYVALNRPIWRQLTQVAA